jgi:hypothetical protein
VTVKSHEGKIDYNSILPLTKYYEPLNPSNIRVEDALVNNYRHSNISNVTHDVWRESRSTHTRIFIRYVYLLATRADV